MLNAKDYGIPQNRERVFVISIRKDIDTKTFSFPEKQKLTLCLRDMLEDTVDSKYFLTGKYDSIVKVNDNYSLLQGGVFGGFESTRRVYETTYVAPTISTCGGGNTEPKIFDRGYVRKLTPKECWRLMGFDDIDIDKCSNVGMSNTQLYKQAGNSIVVNVLQAIFRTLF